MAEPLTPRYYPALANYQDRYVLLIAGRWGGNYLHSVDMYNVKSNQWQPAPQINQKRRSSSSCSVQKFAYIFGGYNGSSCLNSIERIDMDALTAGDQSAQWELLTIANQQEPTPGSDLAMAPIGAN